MMAPRKGGIEFAFVRWTEALLALGHQVTCVVKKNAEIIPHLPESVRMFEVRAGFEWDPIALLRLRLQLANLRPDRLITHGHRAGRLLGYANGGRVKHINVLHRPRFKKMAKYEAVACVTKALLKDALAHGLAADRLHYVPNFLPSGQTFSVPRREFRQPPVIGVLGRMVPEKGIDLFMEAFARVSGERDVRAIIGGDGSQRPEIEALISRHGLQQRVTLAGWVEDSESFYRSIDVLCVPSRAESFGLIILEAWAGGVPVIATRTSGPMELMTSNVDGLLCEPTVEGIVAAIEEALRQPALMQGMANQAASTVRQFTIEAVMPQIEALLTLERLNR